MVLKGNDGPNCPISRGKQADKMAGPTRLELATSGVTGQSSHRVTPAKQTVFILT